MLLRGSLITLRPATRADRRAVYEWAACSDLTPTMMGPPHFPDAPVPTWEQFCSDYQPHFFDGSKPHSGRSFIIEHNGQAVGHVNYDGLDQARSFAELDIWMRDSLCCGQGWGSDALRTLARHLHEAYGIRVMILRPSARNTRAIRSYEKAGFERVPLTAEAQAARYGPGDYDDSVVMQFAQGKVECHGTGSST